MTTRSSYLAIAAIAAFISGCASGFKATHDHDPAQDFGTYQTFAWISENPMTAGPSSRISNPLLEARIMAEIEDSLRAKGYEKVGAAESADFVLAFTVGSRDEVRVSSNPTMTTGGYTTYGRPGRWGTAYYGYGTQTTVRQYTKGMLAIDVFDVKDRKPVWHGVATKSINESDRKDAEGTIRAAVDAVLAGFPP